MDPFIYHSSGPLTRDTQVPHTKSLLPLDSVRKALFGCYGNHCIMCMCFELAFSQNADATTHCPEGKQSLKPSSTPQQLMFIEWGLTQSCLLCYHGNQVTTSCSILGMVGVGKTHSSLPVREVEGGQK